jgi:hypothetical protein
VGASRLKAQTYGRGPAVAFWEGVGYGRRSVIFETYLDESPTND